MLECQICGEVFPGPRGLKTHKSKQHSDRRTCEFCGKECKSPLGLKQHLGRTHPGLRDRTSKITELDKAIAGGDNT